MYKISIIAPCYNTKPWLDECLQSLVNQTLQEIEIICVNDGSTDGTGDRLDKWQTQQGIVLSQLAIHFEDRLDDYLNI